MECDALTHETSESRHSYLPCHVKKSGIGKTHIKQQWKKYRKNFCQFIQICCKKNLKNNGNCEAEQEVSDHFSASGLHKALLILSVFSFTNLFGLKKNEKARLEFSVHL